MDSYKDINLDNFNHLCDILYIFHKNYNIYLTEEISKYNLNLVQVLCIFRINNSEGLCQKDLSNEFYLTKGAITKAISKLEYNGIVYREKSKNDKRQYVLNLTQKGYDLIPILEKINSEWESKMGLNELDDEFFETCKKLTFRAVMLNNKQ